MSCSQAVSKVADCKTGTEVSVQIPLPNVTGEQQLLHQLHVGLLGPSDLKNTFLWLLRPP